MNHFDLKAKTWDENPQRFTMAQAVATALQKLIPIAKNWTALDYGCGTGNLSFLLHEKIQSITMADESTGMLEVLDSKIALHNTTNLHPIKLNLLEDEYTRTHDLIVTLMAMHHIIDTKAILQKFYSILNNNGYICIGDLVEEDGSFHALHDDFNGHNGFNIQMLENLLISTGFKDVQTTICYTMDRDVNDVLKSFPIFLMTGKK